MECSLIRIELSTEPFWDMKGYYREEGVDSFSSVLKGRARVNGWNL